MLKSSRCCHDRTIILSVRLPVCYLFQCFVTFQQDHIAFLHPVYIGSVYSTLVYVPPKLLGRGTSPPPKAADEPSFVQCVRCVHDE